MGIWYNLSIRPYRTTNNIIDGLVLTFTEVTTQKQAQATLDNSKFLQQVFNTIDNCLIELDQDLRVIGANQAFYDLFETTEDATIGEMLYHLGNGQWDIPDLRRLLTEILPHKTVVYDYTVTHDFPKLGTRTMHINARHIAEVDRVLLVITDISEIKS